MSQEPAPARRTKRRYAHELFPHPDEREARPLAVEVPYLYARAIGLGIWGTDWFDVLDRKDDSSHAAMERTNSLVQATHLALLADALAQGLAGEEAWAWATERNDPEGEWRAERAEHYGVPIDQIKPYPVIAEGKWHYHHLMHESGKFTHSVRIQTPEPECEDCTEPVEGDPR